MIRPFLLALFMFGASTPLPAAEVLREDALAIRAAELIPPGRFRRIIFLSAKERELSADGQRPLGSFVLPSYLEMLNAIARELEQPELAKSVESERADTVLRALRDKDVLLVLDNLETLLEADRS